VETVTDWEGGDEGEKLGDKEPVGDEVGVLDVLIDAEADCDGDNVDD